MDRLAAFIVGEGNWLPLAMTIAGAATLISWHRRSSASTRARIQGAMNLFVGVTLLVMGIGHLLAVTAKLIDGSLTMAVPLLYGIGVAIVTPAGCLVRYAHTSRAFVMNAWMAVTLVALGLINIPLAIPAVLNMAYSRHSRRGVATAILAATIFVHLGLFAGGMLFMLSGAATFDDFSRGGLAGSQ